MTARPCTPADRDACTYCLSACIRAIAADRERDRYTQAYAERFNLTAIATER